MQREIDRYLARLSRLGRAEGTIRTYRRVLEEFARSVDASDPSVVTDDHIEDWLASHAGLKASTRSVYLSAVRSFFTYLARNGKVARDPVDALGDLPRQPKPRPTYYTPEQAARLILAAKDPVERVLFTLLLRHGQRISSVIRLRWADVDFSKAEVRYPIVKGGDPITMPLDRDTAKLLKALHALAGECPWVFPGNKQNHISYSPVRWKLQAACKRAGVPYRGCHELRRTCVTTLLQQGYPLHVVSKRIAGHASVNTTTTFYAGVDEDDVASMLRGLPF